MVYKKLGVVYLKSIPVILQIPYQQLIDGVSKRFFTRKRLFWFLIHHLNYRQGRIEAITGNEYIQHPIFYTIAIFSPFLIIFFFNEKNAYFLSKSHLKRIFQNIFISEVFHIFKYNGSQNCFGCRKKYGSWKNT